MRIFWKINTYTIIINEMIENMQIFLWLLTSNGKLEQNWAGGV